MAGTAIGAVGGGVVLDSSGVVVPPQLPWATPRQWPEMFREEWGSIEELSASLAAMAPKPAGLPDGAPSPNDVYRDDRTGLLYRHVIDPEFRREPFVQRNDDGSGEVRERLQFAKRFVALSMQKARDATDRRNAEAGEPETDFWCGYTWLRGGYSPERTGPVEAQMMAMRSGGAPLVFDQPASPSDAARLRHEVANLDRRSPTLPVESVSPKRGRGRPPKNDEQTPDADASVED